MNRVALIGIMVENKNSAEKINKLLTENSAYITGRMGLPNAGENLSVISVVMDAAEDVINTLSGKLGQLDGVSSKTIYAKKPR